MATNPINLTPEEVNTPQLLAEAVNGQFSKMASMIQGVEKTKSSKEDWAKLVMENKEILNQLEVSTKADMEIKAQLEKMQQAAKEQGEHIARVTQYMPTTEVKTFGSEVTRQLKEGVMDEFIEQKAAKGRMEIKTDEIFFGGMGGGTTVGSAGAAQHAAMAFTTPQFAPMENADVRLVVPTGTINSSKLDYPQEAAYVDATAAKLENAPGVQSGITFEMKSATTTRITTFIEVSRTAMRNTSWLIQHINNRLMSHLIKAINTQVIMGNGQTVNLKGLVPSAIAFDTKKASFAGSVLSPTPMDVFNLAAGAMEESSNITPDTILLNPVNRRIMASAKNTIADFINPSTFLRSDSANYNSIFGMTPVGMKDIVAGDYLVAAMRPEFLQLLFNGPIEILATDSHAANFVSDLVTIKITANVMLPIYNVNALMTGTIATDIATITVASAT